MPQPVRPDALLIHEIFALAHVRDLGDPARPHPRQQPDAILQQLPRIHPRRDTAHDLETQVCRRERVEIARRGEKFPHLLRLAPDQLLAMKMPNHGGNGATNSPGTRA